MDTELFELCKEVYKRTEWKDRTLSNFWDMSRAAINEKTWRDDDRGIELHNSEFHPTDRDKRYICPLYTSDYLLEKLPKGLTTIYGRAYPLSPQVMASGDMYYAMYKHDMTGPNSEKTFFEVEADTPLKALLKLTIALDDAGEIE